MCQQISYLVSFDDFKLFLIFKRNHSKMQVMVESMETIMQGLLTVVPTKLAIRKIQLKL